MRIEKRFYDLAKAQWDEIEKEVRQEEESRTEAEREIERLKPGKNCRKSIGREKNTPANGNGSPMRNRYNSFIKSRSKLCGWLNLSAAILSWRKRKIPWGKSFWNQGALSFPR